MEYQHKLLLLAALLVAVALYVMSTTAQPIQPSNETETLLMKSAGFGKGLGDYTYSYSETMNGYKTTYLLTRSGGSELIEIQNALSTKKVYLLPNDTIFCIRYPINESCTSIQQDAEMQNYISFARSKFFNDTNLAKAESDLQTLLDKEYLQLDTGIVDSSVGSVACKQLSYVIDYTNATVGDAAKYGIGADSPKLYYVTRCIAENGLAYDTTLRWYDKGINNTRVMRVLSFRENATTAITPPAELVGDAVEVFRQEREWWIDLATCHTDKQGDDRDKCVSEIALKLQRKDICELGGARRNLCLLSIVPYTKDETICTAISDQSFKDDCYGVLADVNEDSSYCARIQNASKVQTCINVSTPHAPDQSGNQTVGGDETDTAASGGNETDTTVDGGNDSGVDMNEFLNYIDKNDGSDGNQTGGNETDTTANGGDEG
ncbi:MAG: hypothetical protein PHF60_00045 [Candidatus ainarchaeum sp.]|nr:hypothetical protein [Candidatus ainarchaeum sp.]